MNRTSFALLASLLAAACNGSPDESHGSGGASSSNTTSTSSTTEASSDNTTATATVGAGGAEPISTMVSVIDVNGTPIQGAPIVVNEQSGALVTSVVADSSGSAKVTIPTGGSVHPTIMVTDAARARASYEGKLGLEVVRVAGPYTFLRAGTTQLAIVARASVTPGATTTCAFEVEDLKATLNALRERGVVFEQYDTPNLKTVDGIAEVGPFAAAWMRDPDGNFIGIHDSPRT